MRAASLLVQIGEDFGELRPQSGAEWRFALVKMSLNTAETSQLQLIVGTPLSAYRVGWVVKPQRR